MYKKLRYILISDIANNIIHQCMDYAKEDIERLFKTELFGLLRTRPLLSEGFLEEYKPISLNSDCTVNDIISMSLKDAYKFQYYLNSDEVCDYLIRNGIFEVFSEYIKQCCTALMENTYFLNICNNSGIDKEKFMEELYDDIMDDCDFLDDVLYAWEDKNKNIKIYELFADSDFLLKEFKIYDVPADVMDEMVKKNNLEEIFKKADDDFWKIVELFKADFKKYAECIAEYIIANRLMKKCKYDKIKAEAVIHEINEDDFQAGMDEGIDALKEIFLKKIGSHQEMICKIDNTYLKLLKEHNCFSCISGDIKPYIQIDNTEVMKFFTKEKVSVIRNQYFSIIVENCVKAYNNSMAYSSLKLDAETAKLSLEPVFDKDGHKQKLRNVKRLLNKYTSMELYAGCVHNIFLFTGVAKKRIMSGIKNKLLEERGYNPALSCLSAETIIENLIERNLNNIQNN